MQTLQKNQDAIRTSETKLSTVFTLADLAVDLDNSYLLSDQIQTLCDRADGAIFSSENDIRNASKGKFTSESCCVVALWDSPVLFTVPAWYRIAS